MLFPCEMSTRLILPAIRTALVKELRTKYKLTQTAIAKKLFITQASVNHYLKGVRGSKMDIGDAEVNHAISALADELMERELSSTELTRRYCEVCRLVIAKKSLLKGYGGELPLEASEFC